MFKIIAYSITTLLTSLYLFPIAVKDLPGTNTKIILAVIGLLVYFISLPKMKKRGLSNYMMVLSALAGLVSFFGVVSIAVNGTPDWAYASYIVSMWVWVGGAYAVLFAIRSIHGHGSVILIVNYLTAVCVFQCVTALLIDSMPPVRDFFISHFDLGHEWLESKNRLFGFGAALDTAGIRFSAVMVGIIAVLSHISDTKYRHYIPLYIISFFIIAIVGNMIARTTTVGLIISLIFIAYNLTLGNRSRRRRNKSKLVIFWAVLLTIIGTGIVYVYYQTSEIFQENIRFGFEGFFSLAEKGEWDVSSNDKLATMVVWPESLKTWLIGDGYFSNPYDIDPYYTGDYIEGFYMGTDIGYLRFLFYFGLPGLLAFTVFIIYSGIFCAKISPLYKRMFFFMVLVNFVVWFKVATDIFCVFALFLMLDPGEDTEAEHRITLNNNYGDLSNRMA